MAMEVSAKSEKTGLEYIWESRAIYADILFSFRQCHDLCVQSKLFKDETILQIDQCGVDFRQLSLDTVTVAKRVSTQWLDVAIDFFGNIDEVNDPEERAEMLKLLGGQARELAKCFKTIAAWARDLCGRLHKAQDGTIKEAEEFKRRFQAAQERAEKTKREVQASLDKAAKLRKGTQETEDRWKTARVALSWNPLGLLVTSIGTSIAESKTAEARELEEKAHEELSKAAAELEQCKDQNEKAKIIASKASELVEVLTNLETISEAIAAFWTDEANKFDAQGAKMGTTHAVMVKKTLKGRVVKDNIAMWTKAKDELDRYATAMSVINNRFNFVTKAKPPTAQSFGLPNLDLILHIPSSIDVKAITAH